MKTRHRSLVALVALLWAVTAQAFDHGAWDALLTRHVVPIRGGAATQVDYGAMARDRGVLKGYLDALAAMPRRRS